MMEPWLMEQQHTTLLDTWAARLPHCDLCGDPISTPRYLHLDGRCICDTCIERNMEFNLEAIVE